MEKTNRGVKLSKIHNEDCKITISNMDNDSVDYVITSPPYNFGKDSIHKKDKYSTYTDNLSQEHYFNWQKEIIYELLRITKKYIFYNIQLLSGNKVALFRLFGEFAINIKEVIIWDKIYGEPAMLPGVLNSVYEFVVVFTKFETDKRQFSDLDFRGTVDNVIRSKKNAGNKIVTKEPIVHTALMPLLLARKLIQTFMKQGSIVYDPFMGEGTTAIACLEEGNYYIGSEISEEYCKLAEKRIQNYKNQLNLFKQ